MRTLARGVTLIELILVIVVSAILAAMMANFVVPMLQYFESSRRAELSDIADTAARRIGRDLRLALPNSVRVSADNLYVEFLLMRSGGRYRADTGSSGGVACPADGSADRNMLRIGAADACFKTLGNIPNASSVTTSDFVVVYNLQPGTDGADAYENGNATCGNKALVTGLTTEASQERIEIQSATFTYESPASRFHIIEGPVTYACDLGAKELRRYSGYAISAGVAGRTQPPAPSGASALVVSNLTGCTFTYDPNTVAGSDGLVTLRLSVSNTSVQGVTETVSLYYSLHVSNVP